MILRRATKSISLRPENNTKKMCFYKFVATLLLSLTHKTSKTLQINRLHQIKNILHRKKFGMTTSAIYSFVSRFAIPKKKIKRQVFYSKKHVDIAKDLAKAEPEYYTTAEAMEKYNLTRDQLYHYVKWHHISKVQEGKYIKISRKELDDLLAPPSI